jgi:GntR family transcriptional regulator
VNLSDMHIERSSPIPLYYQLAEAVRERIERGDLRPGDQLPAERLLAESAGISRMTARQAVAHLVSQGVLEVRHGVGTFVAAPKLSHDPSHLRGFSEEMLARGGAVTSQVLEQTVTTPSPAIASALGIAIDEPVLRIVRVRSLNGESLLLERSVLRQGQCAALLGADLEHESLYQVLEHACGVRVHHAAQTIEASAANAYEADVLGVREGLPVLLLEGVTFTEQDDPIEHFKAIYRGDRFRFELGGHSDAVRNETGNGIPFGLVMTE